MRIAVGIISVVLMAAGALTWLAYGTASGRCDRLGPFAPSQCSYYPTVSVAGSVVFAFGVVGVAATVAAAIAARRRRW